MKDFYKKLMKMSIEDAEEIARESEMDAVNEMAMQLYQTRVRHWQLKATEEHQLDFPDDPTAMYD
ncbi:hypothetical protein [Halococcus hamelinensis]|uniref:Uncharacterized protein n=1 Tax=Halococcus hamelinensis 100A6 TaxID=1132509 RepID=M0LYB7_9EURY|nr:hypothetical protein [Halococcus hamelinensis]EMA38168.1 hypothetical protein C447_10585 [Halococcus hamelinensis 100A6]